MHLAKSVILGCIAIQGCGAPAASPEPSSSMQVHIARGELPDEARRATERPDNGAGQTEAAEVPEVKFVEKMIAESYGHLLDGTDIEPFIVPPKDYETILKHFRMSEIDRTARPVDREMGTVRLILSGGTTVRYCWFWIGQKGRLSFSYGGIRYRSVGERFAQDETFALDAIVRKIHDSSVDDNSESKSEE